MVSINDRLKDLSKANLICFNHNPTIYVIKGSPTPLQRARHGNGRTWDPQKEAKVIHGIDLVRQHNDRELYCGSLFLLVMFYMQIPLKGKIENYDGRLHVYRPDVSNLLKFVEDIATSILYNDDCLIAETYAEKRYDRNPRTEFCIIQIKE